MMMIMMIPTMRILIPIVNDHDHDTNNDDYDYNTDTDNKDYVVQ